MVYRVFYSFIAWYLSLCALGNDIPCETIEKLSTNQTYFKQLIENWPSTGPKATAFPHLTNEIGLSVNPPKRIKSYEVMDINWKLKKKASSLSRYQIKRQISLVRWAEFQKNFQISVQQVQEAIGEREFALYSMFRGTNNRMKPKSNHFFSGKAVIEEGLRPQRIIESWDDLGDIQDLVIVDDAAYSGTQLNHIVTLLLARAPVDTEVRIHLVVPYASNAAKRKVIPGCSQCKVIWYDQALIRQASDITSPWLSAEVDLSLHLTVFEHKLADSISTFPIQVTTEDGMKYSNIITNSAPPFSPEYSKRENFYPLSTLMQWLEARQVGHTP